MEAVDVVPHKISGVIITVYFSLVRPPTCGLKHLTVQLKYIVCIEIKFTDHYSKSLATSIR